MTSFRWGSATHEGRVRDINQDDSLVVADRLFAVADGMGGHRGGEVASALALDVLRREVGDVTTTAELVQNVRAANAAVFAQSEADPDLRGMGTTLTVLAPVESDEGPRLAVINVGDSRIYRLADGELEQLTEDHSLVASLVKQGRLTEEEAETHPQRNIVTRALGIEDAVSVDSWEIAPLDGDRFLLCSDGLFNEVGEERIAATLTRLADPAASAQELVRMANDAGGRDNITVVVVDVLDGFGDQAADGEAGPVKRSGDTDAVPVVGGGPGVEATTTDSTTLDQAPDGGGPVIDAASGPDAEVEVRTRRVTWRVGAFSLALLLVILASVGAVGWYARNTFYVGDHDGEVTIFRGRPGGFLWFDPTVEEATDLAVDDVPAAALPDIEAGREAATLDDARNFVANLERQAEREEEPPPTTTTRPGRGRGGATTTSAP